MKSNKLIARFMEVKIVKRNDEDAVFMALNAHSPEYFRCTHYDRYHNDWNILMPVVEKIERLYKEVFPKDILQAILAKEHIVDWHYMAVLATPLSTPIDEVYDSIVEFIEWYNEQNQNENTDSETIPG